MRPLVYGYKNSGASAGTRSAQRNPAYNDQLHGGRLPYGTTRLTVHSTTVVQKIFGAIQEYGGFERPEWLDQRVESAVAPAEV
jgi:hypothetical protein